MSLYYKHAFKWPEYIFQEGVHYIEIAADSVRLDVYNTYGYNLSVIQSLWDMLLNS